MHSITGYVVMHGAVGQWPVGHFCALSSMYNIYHAMHVPHYGWHQLEEWKKMLEHLS